MNSLKLVHNVTQKDKPDFLLRGLKPGQQLIVRIYSANKQGKVENMRRRLNLYCLQFNLSLDEKYHQATIKNFTTVLHI